jgi:hypothetical protein
MSECLSNEFILLRKRIGIISKEENKCVKECKGDDSLKRKKRKNKKIKEIEKEKKNVYFSILRCISNT